MCELKVSQLKISKLKHGEKKDGKYNKEHKKHMGENMRLTTFCVTTDPHLSPCGLLLPQTPWLMNNKNLLLRILETKSEIRVHGWSSCVSVEGLLPVYK